jgi:hypothetical protein
MTALAATLLIVGAIIATVLVVRSLSHAGKAAVRADWPGEDCR